LTFEMLSQTGLTGRRETGLSRLIVYWLFSIRLDSLLMTTIAIVKVIFKMYINTCNDYLIQKNPIITQDAK